MNDHDKMKIASPQPLPERLRTALPVNYFLFVKNTTEGYDPLVAESKEYNTPYYRLLPFYKSISNVV